MIDITLPRDFELTARVMELCQLYRAPYTEDRAAALMDALERNDGTAARRALNIPLVPDPEKDTAYHEAGHVVAACRFDFPIKEVSIERTSDGRAGHWDRDLAVAVAGRKEDQIWKSAVITLASEPAARLGTGTCDMMGVAEDNEMAATYAVLVTPGRGGKAHKRALEWLSRANQAADKLIAEHAGAVHAMAAALVKERTLTGARVTAMVNAAPQAKVDIAAVREGYPGHPLATAAGT